MALPFLGPIGLFVGKVVLERLMDYIKDEAKDKIEKRFRDYCIPLVVNIVLLSLAAIVVPWFATPGTTRYIVFSVYFSIIIHFFFRWSQRIWGFIKFLKNHRYNLREYIAQGENIWRRFIIIVFWRSIFVPKIWLYGSYIVLATVLYILVFRLVIAPSIESTTGLGYIESAVYPFMFSIDYFFGPGLLTSVGNFLAFDHPHLSAYVTRWLEEGAAMSETLLIK